MKDMTTALFYEPYTCDDYLDVLLGGTPARRIVHRWKQDPGGDPMTACGLSAYHQVCTAHDDHITCADCKAGRLNAMVAADEFEVIPF